MGNKTMANVFGDLSGKVKGVTDKTKDVVLKTKESIINTIDENGNGEIDIEDIIIKGMKTPGIRINRSNFLKKELAKKYPKEVVDDAILYNPAHAGITVEELDKISNEVIQYERNCVSGISAALGAPGGVAMVATIPADIVQYYGYMLRATQELLYLYSFPEIEASDDGQIFDSETMNILIICLGIMYGAAGANNAITAMAKGLASGVEKNLMKKALTKGAIYPIVKSIAKWFNVKMTKEIFAGFFKHSIPIVGGVLGGGLTYLSFKPCCDKLKSSLQDTYLSNSNHIETEDENIIYIYDEQINNMDDEKTSDVGELNNGIELSTDNNYQKLEFDL